MSEEVLTVKVINKYSTGGSNVTFKIQKKTKMIKLIRAYEHRQGVEKGSLHFIFNGARISETDTAESIHIENDGHIDCCIPRNSKIVSTELYDLCISDNLSLDALQEKINLLGRRTIRKACDEEYPLLYTFFHQVCLNKRITLDIVNYLLKLFPKAANVFIRADSGHYENAYDGSEASALHYLCYNQYCPSSVIELLVKKHPESTKVKGVFWINNPKYNRRVQVEGLPMHCYMRRISNIDIKTVKTLVEAFPTALTTTTSIDTVPIHLLLSHPNINEMLDILLYLLESEPSSIRKIDCLDRTPLNITCDGNKGVNLDVVQILYNAWPEAIGIGDCYGRLPIHNLLGDVESLDILRFMLDIDPTLARVGDEDMYLPILHASCAKSTTFCKVLFDSYPQSLKQETLRNSLPLHIAFSSGRKNVKNTIQYMLDLYPESMNARYRGLLPIHLAAADARRVGVLEVLFKHDPDAAMRETSVRSVAHHQLPLHIACANTRKNFSTRIVRTLFDAYPEAINILDRRGQSSLNLAKNAKNKFVVTFLKKQLIYAKQAQDTTAMTTPDEEGYLPLHRDLLQGDISLGSIKMIVKGNPDALQVADPKGVLLLHIACRKATASIVNFFADLCGGLDICDTNKDYPLHHACQTANVGVIKYLMERNTPWVSETNAGNKLPFHLLVEHEDDQVRDSPEFAEACFLLLRAHPETVMIETTSRKRKRD